MPKIYRQQQKTISVKQVKLLHEPYVVGPMQLFAYDKRTYVSVSLPKIAQFVCLIHECPS